MALEVVGGAFLSSFLNVLFERMVPTADFFKTRKMSAAQLEKLETLLIQVNEVLDDAEHKQIASSNVKAWLLKLRDAAYEAVDLLDLIDYQAAATAKVETDQQTTCNKMWDCFTFRNPFEKALRDKQVSKKMDEIIGRLEPLVHNIRELGLRDGGRKDASLERPPATSVVEESGIFGRDDDREAIFKLLQQNDMERRDTAAAVIPIVGMGGIGKTTLAQLIYNDSRAQQIFDCRAWVCVSENYDSFRIKREVLKQVNKSQSCDNLISEEIDVGIKESLKSKRYLLVLDDVWNEKYEKWDELQTLLESGGPGSKIIVTTRSEAVASVMRTVPSYQLGLLDANYCWVLFVKYASSSGTAIGQRLEAIGKEIVRKCKGLPLATKMLGGLLRSERDVSKWEEVLNSNIWDLRSDSILPSLRLSYQHLPPYLKQCFAYCAIFPKDYEMDKQEIIRLWMAQGFLTQPVGRKMMEELGEECFDELVSRSFLQESRNKWDGPFFLMHDLINDLARQIFGEFLARIEDKDCVRIHAKTRHVSYMASQIDGLKIHESISQVHVMHSFLTVPLSFPLGWKYPSVKKRKEIVDDLLQNQIPRLWSLRVLSLCGFDGLMTMPDSIDNLKLLRYLNVAKTSLEKLPESLCSLYNLQTLILYGCQELVELPKFIGGLINMRCLDIRNTPRLQEMPQGMGNLENLRILCKFIVGNQNGLHINELGKLKHLRGALTIFKLQNVVELSKYVLQNKKYLEDLKLEWSSTAEDAVQARNILERLQPHTSVKRISIFGYGGTKFADWVGDPSYTNMVSLELEGCKHCTSLPPLGQLSSLKCLSIIGFDEVEELGDEFCGVGETPFRTLETLKIKDMRQLKKWIICEGNNSDKCESFAKLERLTVRNCRKLESIKTCEPTHKSFKSLNEWDVECCPNLRTSYLVAISNFKKLRIASKQRRVYFEKLPSAMYKLRISPKILTSWTLSGNEECDHRMEGNEEMRFLSKALYLEKINIIRNTLLESIPLEMFPKLQSLSLSYCNNLNSLAASEEPLLQPLTSLHSLEISDCRNLISFPKGGIAAPNLTHLKLSYCSNLRSLPEWMHVLLPSLQHLIIDLCGEIESFPEGGLPAKLQSLNILSCKKLIGGRLKWGLQRLDSLSHFCLEDYYGDGLNFFPELNLLPFSLSSLEIKGFRNLKYINSEGLQDLTSLHHLRIKKCNNLQCLPEGLPSSVSYLEIEDCELLKGRCEREKGEDWPKISHISAIEINGVNISP